MIDYCKTRLSVARRTINFVDLHLAHENKTLDDFNSFEEFLKFLKDTGITKTCGFNINKRGYMETLKFCYSLKEVQHGNSL